MTVNSVVSSIDSSDKDINYQYSKTRYFTDETYIEEKFYENGLILHRHSLLDPSGNKWSDESFNDDGSTLESEEVNIIWHSNEKIKEIITTYNDTIIDLEIYNYDSLNNLIKQTNLTSDGNINSVEYFYDELGRQKEIAIKENEKIITRSIFNYKLINLVKEESIFDSANHLLQKFIYYHDFDGNIVKSEEYNKDFQIYCTIGRKYINEKLIEELIFDNNYEVVYQTIYTYDSLDLLKERKCNYLENGLLKKTVTFMYYYEFY